MTKEYIERDALKRILVDKYNFFPVFVKNAIEEVPTADVIEVVRCKNCKHFMTDVYKRTMCDRTFTMYVTNENDFCSYGERRTK